MRRPASGRQDRARRFPQPVGSQRPTPAAAGVGVLAAFACWSLLGSCESSDEPVHVPPLADAAPDVGAGAHPDGSIDSGTGGEGGNDVGGGGHAGCGVSPTGSWSPETDSCWRPVDWPAPCDVRIAEQPELAVPRLEWEPCPWGQPGCTMLAPSWLPAADQWSPVFHASVTRATNGYHVGLMLRWPEGSVMWVRSAVYDPTGRPMAAWHGFGGVQECGPGKPLVGPTRSWIGGSIVSSSGLVTESYVSALYAELGTASDAIDYHAGAGSVRGNDDTLAIQLMSGNDLAIHDRLSGTTDVFAPPGWPDYAEAYPVGDSVLVGCYLDGPMRKACIWNRGSHDMQPLVAPPDDYIASVGSDGETLAWVRCPPGEPVADWSQCKLWTSPFVTSAATLEPTLRCAAPQASCYRTAAGEDHFATCGEELSFHLYRLADGRHWTIPFGPSGQFGEVRDIVYVDAEELWALTTLGLVRQRIDALGPGEPCPAP